MAIVMNKKSEVICVIFKKGQYFGEKESDQKLIKDLTGLEFLSRFDLEKLKTSAAKNGILSICITHPLPEYQPPKKS